MLDSLIRDFGNFFFLRLMNRWVAGPKAEDAISYCGNSKSCIINYLGEHYKEIALADSTVNEYRHLVDIISSSGVKASITIKPSQFGFNALDVEDPTTECEQRMLEIVRYASKKGVAVWLDMENSSTTDFTLNFYKKYAGTAKMGVCLQANLKRTENDLLELVDFSKKAKVMVRLVKGIYVENPSISLVNQNEIHKNFLGLIKTAFEKSGKDFGIAVGSHHTEAIELALGLQKKHPKDFFEIEVLKGVLPAYYGQLRERKVPLSEYVPYGPDAFAYSVRRARKNPKFASSIIFAPFFDAYKKLYAKS